MTTLEWLAAAGARLGRGLIYLARRAITWPWSDAEGGERIGRIVGLVVTGWVILRVTGALPWTRWMLVVGLLAWAYSLDAKERDRDGGTTAREATEPDEPSDDEINAAFRDAMLTRLRALIGEANGVHLQTLHQLLAIDGRLPDSVDLTGLRKRLEYVGIPVRDSIKLHGTVRVGVHRDDLPDHSPTNPEEGPEEG